MLDTKVRVLDEFAGLVGGYLIVYDNPGSGSQWTKDTVFGLDDACPTVKDVPILWCHLSGLVIGECLGLAEDSSGIRIIARINRRPWFDYPLMGLASWSVGINDLVKDSSGVLTRANIREASVLQCPACRLTGQSITESRGQLAAFDTRMRILGAPRTKPSESLDPDSRRCMPGVKHECCFFSGKREPLNYLAVRAYGDGAQG